MFISMCKITALAPFIIFIFSISIILLSILIKRNHRFVVFNTVVSLLSILCILPFIYYVSPVYVTSLIYINHISVIYMAIVIISTLLIIFIVNIYLEKFFLYKEEFYLLVLSSLLGSLLLINSNHMFSVLIGIELLYFPVIGLMMYSVCKKNIVKVVFKYVLLSSVMTVLSLFGISFIYLICGNLNFYNIKISILICNTNQIRILLLGVMFVFVSFLFKLSLFPFYFWVCDIYKNVSPVILMYLSTVVKISIFSSFIRLFSYLPYQKTYIIYSFIKFISIFSIVFGSIMTVSQKNIKKFFGYSSISHVGYLIITLLTVNNYTFSNQIAIIYLINYTISSIGIFTILVLFQIFNKSINSKTDSIDFYRGLVKRHPMLSIMMTIMILSFLGLPLTLGFFSKFLIIFLSVNNKFWLIALAILINSIIGIYYYFKIMLNLYHYDTMLIDNVHCKLNNYLKIFIILVSFMILFFGIFPQLLLYIVSI